MHCHLAQLNSFFHSNRLRLGTSDMPGTIPSSENTTFIPSSLGRRSRDCRIYLRMLGRKEAIQMQENQRAKVVSVKGSSNILAWQRRRGIGCKGAAVS